MPIDYKLDTIENKLSEYNGQDIVSFLDDQIGYFCLMRANTEGKIKEHYQEQLNITGLALTYHVKGINECVKLSNMM